MELSPNRKLRYSIYAGPPLERLVSERVDDLHPPTTVVNVVADRYLNLLNQHRPQLTADEWMLVFDAQNGALQDETAATLGQVWRNIASAIQHDGLAEKWAVDEAALLKKLKALHYVEAVALVDTAERFWRLFAHRSITREEALRALGIQPDASTDR